MVNRRNKKGAAAAAARQRDSATGGESAPFDYSALIPRNVSGEQRRLVERFLRNEQLSEEEREQAVGVFANALIVENGSSLTAALPKPGVSGLSSSSDLPSSSSSPSSSSAAAAASSSSQPNRVVAARRAHQQTSPKLLSAPPPPPSVECNDSNMDSSSAAMNNGGETVEREKMDVGGQEESSDPPAAMESAVQQTPAASAASKPLTTEDHARINIGWMAFGDGYVNEVVSHFPHFQETDTGVGPFCQKLGSQMYNYVVYPIGGQKRASWTPSADSTSPPPLNVPDMQLANNLWEQYICGLASPWIDCDSEEEWLATMSERELLVELNYAAYLGLRSLVVQLTRTSSPRLAAVLSRFLWTRACSLSFWIIVPSCARHLKSSSADCSTEQEPVIWRAWADFRKACGNYPNPKLVVGIRFGDCIDDEFGTGSPALTWKAEPLCVFWLETSAFTTHPVTGHPALPPSTAALLEELWTDDAVCRGAVSGRVDDELQRTHMVCQLRVAVRNSSRNWRALMNRFHLSDAFYSDMLQAPLQPLSDNLDSIVYNTFEQDPVKYRLYGEATQRAVEDMLETRGLSGSINETPLVVAVLGAGRGPLVSAVFEAEARINHTLKGAEKLRLTVLVVEKNANAIVTLRYCNATRWGNRARIVESDMRTIAAVARRCGLPQPDVIVSELLGSFGDNELSPECLDGVTDWLKPSTISIPQSYTSFIRPIAGLSLHQKVVAAGSGSCTSFYLESMNAHGRHVPVVRTDGSWTANIKKDRVHDALDQLYVVCLQNFCPLSSEPPKKVFHFVHPNHERSSNERHVQLEWTVEREHDLMGLGGYFSMVLYRDVVMSIVPSEHTDGLISWFPALIPARQLVRVLPGQKVVLNMWRKVDSTGVWYEWSIDVKDGTGVVLRQGELQNADGESYYMRLLPLD